MRQYADEHYRLNDMNSDADAEAKAMRMREKIYG